MSPLRNTLLAAIVAAALAVVPTGALAASQPSIESESVSIITQSGATLEAQIAPGATAAYYQFEVVSDPNEYRSEIACPLRSELRGTDGCQGSEVQGVTIGYMAAGAGAKSVSLDLADSHTTLTPGTTYHYRVLAATAVPTEDTIQWEGPAVEGADQTFTTASSGAAPSEVLTGPAEATANGVRLKGRLNPDGVPTTYYYEYGSVMCDELPACKMKTAVVGPLTGDVQQEAPPIEVTGLTPLGTYWYRLVATNADGSEGGAFVRFTALPEDHTGGTGQGTPQPNSQPSSTPPFAPLARTALPTPASKPKTLTKAHKLAKAIEACKKRKPRSKRTACEKQAHRQYGAVKYGVGVKAVRGKE